MLEGVILVSRIMWHDMGSLKMVNVLKSRDSVTSTWTDVTYPSFRLV